MSRLMRVGFVSASGITASLFSFLVFVAAGRNLSSEALSEFAAIWGILFAMASVLSAFELEAARQASRHPHGMREIYLAAAITSLGVACIVVAALPLLSRLLHAPILAVGAVAAGSAFYPMLFVTRGHLAGRGELEQLAAVTFLEGLLRPLSLLAVGMTSVWQFTWATAIGATAWLPWSLSAFRELTPGGRASSTTTSTLSSVTRRVGMLMSGNIASAILLAGMPATIIVVLGGSDDVGVATAVVALAVSRAPLVLLSSVYGLAVPWFIQRDGATTPHLTTKQFRGLTLAAAVTAVIGSLGLGLAVDVLFGGRYSVDLFLSGFFVVGTLLLGGVQIMAARLVASDRHRVVQAMWWVATGSAVGIMVLARDSGLTIPWIVALAQGCGASAGLVFARYSLHHV